MQQYGLGVSIGDVVHARDIFLDKSYRQENGRKGFYTSFYEITDYVQDLFQELNGEQFKQSVSDLHQAFQELEPNMDNSTQQNLVLEKADLLLSSASIVRLRDYSPHEALLSRSFQRGPRHHLYTIRVSDLSRSTENYSTI